MFDGSLSGHETSRVIYLASHSHFADGNGRDGSLHNLTVKGALFRMSAYGSTSEHQILHNCEGQMGLIRGVEQQPSNKRRTAT